MRTGDDYVARCIQALHDETYLDQSSGMSRPGHSVSMLAGNLSRIAAPSSLGSRLATPVKKIPNLSLHTPGKLAKAS